MPRRDDQGTAQQLTPSFWQMGVHIDRCHCTFALPQAHSGHLGFYLDIAAFAVRVASPLPQPSEGGTIKRDEKGVFRAKTPSFIEFSFDAPQQVRSINI